MQQTRLDYQKTRAAIFLKYGVELDETSITILSILSIQQKAQYLEQNKKLEAVTERIKLSTQSLQAHQQRAGWQAFWFGMGQWGLALVFATSVLTGIYFYREAKQQEGERLPITMQWYKAYFDASQTGNRKTITDFLKTHPRQDDNEH
jgi:hypothetical protein